MATVLEGDQRVFDINAKNFPLKGDRKVGVVFCPKLGDDRYVPAYKNNGAFWCECEFASDGSGKNICPFMSKTLAPLTH